VRTTQQVKFSNPTLAASSGPETAQGVAATLSDNLQTDPNRPLPRSKRAGPDLETLSDNLQNDPNRPLPRSKRSGPDLAGPQAATASSLQQTETAVRGSGPQAATVSSLQQQTETVVRGSPEDEGTSSSAPQSLLSGQGSGLISDLSMSGGVLTLLSRGTAVTHVPHTQSGSSSPQSGVLSAASPTGSSPAADDMDSAGAQSTLQSPPHDADNPLIMQVDIGADGGCELRPTTDHCNGPLPPGRQFRYGHE
jgi:hypothetical protein